MQQHLYMYKYINGYLRKDENITKNMEPFILERVQKALKGFSEKDPFAATILANLHLTNEQINSLMSAVENTVNTEGEAARLWMHAHWDIVNSWIPDVMTEEEK